MTVSYERIWRNSRIYWTWHKYMFTQLFSSYFFFFFFFFLFLLLFLCFLSVCLTRYLWLFKAPPIFCLFMLDSFSDLLFMSLSHSLFLPAVLIKPFFEIQSFFLLKTPLYLPLLSLNLFWKVNIFKLIPVFVFYSPSYDLSLSAP